MQQGRELTLMSISGRQQAFTQRMKLGEGKPFEGKRTPSKKERGLTSYIEDLTFSKHVIFKDFFKVHGNAE